MTRRPSRAVALLAGAAIALVVSACSAAAPEAAAPGAPPGLAAERFPKPRRPVAGIVSDQWSSEDSRERAGEAATVMALLGIRPGQAVADIGAGAGYYVGRLSRRVGPEGRVFAQDVEARYLDRLRQRVERERLANVSLVLGEGHDPRLPPRSVDVALLVHMYHEIAQPYEFLWRLRPSLKRDGLVVVVDSDRPTANHGTPPALLRCEFAAVGYALDEMQDMPSAGGYLATFRSAGERPEPKDIKPCRMAQS